MKKILLVMILLLTSCSTQKDDEKRTIYTTIYPVEFIIKTLVEDEIHVVSVIPKGGDAHTYEPTQKDLNGIANSEMFFYFGLGLEEAAEEMAHAVRSEDVKVVEVGKALQLNDDEHLHDETEHRNHHIWIDPLYMIDIANVIETELINNYPEIEEVIVKNKQALVKRVYTLDNVFDEKLKNVNKDAFIVSHDAFAYWQKYGVTSIAVKDEAHSKDPTQKEINEIITIGQDKHLKYVFYEQNIPCLPLDVIKKELGADKLILHNLSVLTEQELKEHADYFSLMYDNLEKLIQALN